MHQSESTVVETQDSGTIDLANGAAAGDDVMRILAGVEDQLNQLRTVQKSQDQAIVSLADRARALQKSEEEIASTREQIAALQQNLQRDREQWDQQRSQRETELKAQRNELENRSEQIKQQASALQSERQQWNGQRAEREAEINKQRSELDQRSAQINQELAAAKTERERWNQQRSIHEAELNKRHEDLEQRSAEINRKSSDFEAERQRVAALVKQCDTRQRQLDERTKQVETEHTELLHRVEQAEMNVGELIHQLEKSQQELALKTEQVGKASNDAASFRKRAAALENVVQQATARVEQSEREAAELAKLADRERETVEKKLASVSTELEATTKARTAAEMELKSLREAMAASEKQLAHLKSQLAERTAQLSDHQKKLELAGRKLSEFAKILSEQTPQLERGAAAIAMVEEQQQQIDRLTKQLAEHKLRSDPEEMDRRDQRIADLTEALRQARGQVGGQVGIAEVEHRNAELTEEVDRLKVELENAQLLAEQAQMQLENRVDTDASVASQDASLAEHAAKIAALTAEIERLHRHAADEVKTKLEAQATKHRQEFEAMHGEDAAAIQALHDRIADLEQQLAEAHEMRDSSPQPVADDEAQSQQKWRDKAERITVFADHLRRRRARLAKVRLLLSHKTTVAEKSLHGRMRTEEVLQIEQDRASLAAARQALAVSEKAMIRKWAGHRAVFTVASLLILAAVCAGASWLLADYFAPAKIAASVTIEARNQQRAQLTGEQAESWRQWHTNLLSEQTFRQTLSKRLAERRLDQVANINTLMTKLDRDLSIDPGPNGSLILTLAGTNPDETVAVLDAIATTVTMESNRHATSRGDNTPATVLGERRDNGVVRYSSIKPVPISDERLALAGPIFGVMLVVCLTLLMIIYVRLTRAKRIFDEDNAALMPA